jgi:putative pyruvate formate lyase activating enzyme
MKDEVGFCKTGRKAVVNSSFLHFQEEPELVAKGGSGTIFFSFCNLYCVFCQNYTISQLGEGSEVDAAGLARLMLTLQKEGAENINFVSPTHVIAQIIEALCIAAAEGLRLPLVYNCGGYESLDVLKTIEGVFDIYMPDIKYADDAIAMRFSHVPRYWEHVRQAVKEMHRQVGDLVIENGTAKRGLLVRHLVLPSGSAGSLAVLSFLKDEISLDTYVNIMNQYRPCYQAYHYEEIAREPSRDEFEAVVRSAHELGFRRGFK